MLLFFLLYFTNFIYTFVLFYLLFVCMAEADWEVEIDFKLTTLVSQENHLTTKIYEVYNQRKIQGRYMPPYE